MSPMMRKSVKGGREEFDADFKRATEQDHFDCLSTEEILAVQSGAGLDPDASEHLRHCRFCSSLRDAIQVEPGRLEDFVQAVRVTPSVEAQRPKPRRVGFDWRLPAAAFTAVASLAMIFLVPKTGSRGSITQASVGKYPSSAPRVEIALKSPSTSPLVVIAKVGTRITVSDYAPQVATAVVLANSEITVPINASSEVTAAAKQEASDMVHGLVRSSATLENVRMTGEFDNVSYNSARKGFELKLSGSAVAWVPEDAISKGLSAQADVLKNSNLLGNKAQSVTLRDGSVLTIEKLGLEHSPGVPSFTMSR